jgi:hypothetical protein
MATIDERFFDRADEIISLTNKQAKNVGSPFLACGSLLYAAARFSAYEVVLKAKDDEKIEAERESAISFFSSQFAEMMEQCIAEHLSGHDRLA